MDIQDIRQKTGATRKQLLEEKIRLVRKIAVRQEMEAADRLHALIEQARQGVEGAVRQAAHLGKDRAIVLRIPTGRYDLREKIHDELQLVLKDPDCPYPGLRAQGPFNYGQVDAILKELGVKEVTSRPTLKWVRQVREQLLKRSEKGKGLMQWLGERLGAGPRLPDPLKAFLRECQARGLQAELVPYDDFDDHGLAVEVRW